MKKFFVTLSVFIIIAALGLYFGWAQLGVPPDSYGLLRSKTHGIDTRLIKPGEFRWVWYKLIPTNATTVTFRLNPVHYELSAHNTLPSGKMYAVFAGVDENFSWEINAVFSFRLKPESLISLVTAYNIGTQDELAYYENDIAKQIEAFLLRRINTDDISSQLTEDLLFNGESPLLEQEIGEQFPLITDFSLNTKSVQFPDFALYRLIKGLYENYISFQKDSISADMLGQTKNRVESYRRISELEQYGALLSKYPILLDYLALEK
ncbi:MAG: hypothetical protein FWC24_05685 [Treponema sp.]|nr:hypothetical protein [Treponema sp.]